MNTVKKLFRHRLISGWRYQYSVWKTVVDWVVALYIVIPFTGIFLDTYLSWWKRIPDGLDHAPLEVFSVIILLFSWSGSLRIFVEDADQIFLFQRGAWVKGIIKYSIAYYIAFEVGMTFLLFFVLAPFLIKHYTFTVHQFVGLLISTVVFKATVGVLKQLLALRIQGWKHGLIKTGLLAISGLYLRLTVFLLINRPILFQASIILLFILLILFIYRRINLKGTLLEDISMGQAAKLKFTNVLLRYAGTYMKKPISFRTRPWLFRDSGLIFKQRSSENALAELCLKSTLRHGANVRFYLQVVGVYGLMLSGFPPAWKWVLCSASVILLTSVVKMYWLESLNSPYVSLFPIRSEVKFRAASRSLFYMALPGEIVLTLFVGLQTQNWFYALIGLPVIVFANKFAAKKFAMFS